MDKIKETLGGIVFIIVAVIIVRTYFWPSTWSEGVIQIENGRIQGECFEFNTGRSLEATVSSDKPINISFQYGSALPKSLEQMRQNALPGTMSPNHLSGVVKAKVESDREICVLYYAASGTARVDYKVVTYLRLF